jgi:predicted nucleic acid-binding protein
MLLDTSGLLCYYHAGEALHTEAVAFVKSAPRLLVHSYVLAEFVSLCHARSLNRVRVLKFAVDLMDNEEVEVVWVDNALHRAALSLLRQRLDKTYSLCDAVSFVLMRQESLTEALTTDRHFEQEGFVRLLQP